MKRTKVRIFYKSKSSGKGHNPYHHGGLAANAMHTVGVLKREGIDADFVAVETFENLKSYLKTNPGVTHAIIEAVWMTAPQLVQLAVLFPDMKIVVRAHSKIGFLQVEPEAIPVMRSIIDLEDLYPNVSFSSNNQEFCNALGEVYGEVLYLPNLYDFEASPPRRHHNTDTLRVASFGATRLLKLHPCAALAALQLAARTGKNLEFYINSDNTPGGHSVRNTIKNLIADLPWAKLVEVNWQDAETFKETIASMDLVYQLSATETFCLVAADAVASGVPVVVGEAIVWVPKRYRVNADDTSEAATVGQQILDRPRRAVAEEREALEHFVSGSIKVWKDFLEPKKKKSIFWWLA